MKILIISYYFPPMNSVASLRVYSWAKVWTDAGNKVTVLTTPKPANDNLLPMRTDSIETIEVSSLLLNIFQKLLSSKYKKASSGSNTPAKGPCLPSFFQMINRWRKRRGIMYTLRMPDYLSLWKRPALDQIKNRKFDVVVSTFGPYVTHLIAEKIIKNKQAARWIADYRDLWVDHGLMKGLFPFTLLERKLQYRINKQADLITTVSEPLAEALYKRGITRDKVYVIYNGYLEQVYSGNAPPLWSDKKNRLVYTGSIYDGAQDYSPFLNAIEELKSSRVDLFTNLEVVIASRNAGKLSEAVTSSQIDECFVFTGNVSHQIALQMQKEADCLLFFDYDPRIMLGVITGKLFEYMISGTEIWSVGSELTETDSNTYIAESQTGKIFGNNAHGIYLQLCKLLTTKTKPVVNGNMKFIKQFTRESQAKKILSLLALDQE